MTHTRYFCPTCKTEFVDGGWVLINNQGSRWTPADGCVRCRSAVEKVTYTPAVPGLDIPRDQFTAPTVTVQQATDVAAPLPMRANDHHGSNDVLSPDARSLPQGPTLTEDEWSFY